MNRKLKKLAEKFICLLLMGTLFTGCVSTGGAPSREAAPTPRPTEADPVKADLLEWALNPPRKKGMIYGAGGDADPEKAQMEKADIETLVEEVEERVAPERVPSPFFPREEEPTKEEAAIERPTPVELSKKPYEEG